MSQLLNLVCFFTVVRVCFTSVDFIHFLYDQWCYCCLVGAILVSTGRLTVQLETPDGIKNLVDKMLKDLG